MNIGLYFDLRSAEASPAAWSRTYGSTLELCQEADRLGVHSVWLSEHHQFDDGYLPQPLTFAAAVAARTRDARIGTAVLLAPLRSPAQIAEEAAVVDQISGGRLELGIGAGYRSAEFSLFDVPFADRMRTTLSTAVELRRLWAPGGVTPLPVQGRLPIWMGFQGPRGARRAGLLGEGLLSSNPALAAPYLAGLQDGGHDPRAARMAGPIHAVISEDPERDWPLVRPHLSYQYGSYARHRDGGAGEAFTDASLESARERGLGSTPGHNLLVGTPAAAAEALRAYIGEAPIESVFFWAAIGDMSHDLAARNVETICRKLAPLLADGGVRASAGASVRSTS